MEACVSVITPDRRRRAYGYGDDCWSLLECCGCCEYAVDKILVTGLDVLWRKVDMRFGRAA